ncbi:minichromosome maintenance complex-binding protein [Tanacetum coccineum]
MEPHRPSRKHKDSRTRPPLPSSPFRRARKVTFLMLLAAKGCRLKMIMYYLSALHVVQPNSLIRFCRMVQDMMGSEFYVDACKNKETWNTNKFSDVAQFPMNPSPDMRVWKRRLLYCVPVRTARTPRQQTGEATERSCLARPFLRESLVCSLGGLEESKMQAFLQDTTVIGKPKKLSNLTTRVGGHGKNNCFEGNYASEEMDNSYNARWLRTDNPWRRWKWWRGFACLLKIELLLHAALSDKKTQIIVLTVQRSIAKTKDGFITAIREKGSLEVHWVEHHRSYNDTSNRKSVCQGFITAIREKGSLEVHWVEHHRSYVETLNKCLGKNDIFYGYTLDELIRMTYQRKSVARI